MTNSQSVRLPVLVNLTSNERITIQGAEVRMGRAPENNVVLPDDGYASANHCRIYWDAGRLLLEDLNSSNGTSLNDKIITQTMQLAPNDVIKVGRTMFRIE